MNPRFRYPAFPLLAALLLIQIAPRAAAAAPREMWYGLFLGGKRMGYMVNTESKTGWRGRPADLSETRVRIDLRVLGTAATTEMTARQWSTSEGTPLEEILITRDLMRTNKVRAVYIGRTVHYQADLAGVRRAGTLHLKPGERFWAGDPFKNKNLRAARTLRYKQFNSTTLSLEDADLTIGARARASRSEVVEVGGQGVAAYKVPLTIGGMSGVAWVDRHDDVLRFDIGPARFVRLPQHLASAPLSERVEVTEIASYVPDKAIVKPRTLRVARYRLENLSAPIAAANDDVQTASVEKTAGGTYTATVVITTGPAGDAPPMPLAEIPRNRFASFLQPSLYVPSNSPKMQALAREIVGAETDARRAGEKLSAWVSKTMAYDPGAGFGTIRHAGEILSSRRGVCQDYATLLVTLARAVGIPAKHCVGVAYGDGRFYNHAWVELWVGRWVAVEPTWGAPFADATHIKLAEGEPTADRKGLSRLDPLRILVLETGERIGTADPNP